MGPGRRKGSATQEDIDGLKLGQNGQPVASVCAVTTTGNTTHVDESSGPVKVDPTFAWTLAAAPLLFAFLPLAFPNIDGATAFWVAVIVNTVLAIADASRLNRAGAHISLLLAWFVIPVYLIVRTIKAKSTPAIPVVWFVAFFASLIIGNQTGPVTFDQHLVERQLETTIKQRIGERPMVDCPQDTAAPVGESFWCDLTASDGTYQVKVTVIDSDGNFEWHIM